MLSAENWQPIKEAPGYFVSDIGGVASTKNGWRLLSPWLESNGYRRVGLMIDGVCQKRWVHRLVGGAFLGLRAGREIDHINGVKVENRLSNLRVVTRRENNWNLPGQTGRSSAYKGVSWDSKRGKWYACIAEGGNSKRRSRTVALGHFDSEIDAALSYDDAAFARRGAFARLNYPNDHTEPAA